MSANVIRVPGTYRIQTSSGTDIVLVDTTATTALTVNGSEIISASLTIGGDLIVGGSINQQSVQTVATSTNVALGTAGAIVYQVAPNTTNFIGTGTLGQVLTMGLNTASWQTVGGVSTATNVAGGAAGAILYQAAPSITNSIATGTTGSLLQMGANTATFVTTSSINVGSAASIAGGILGAIPYQSTTGTTRFISTGTTGSLLQMGANTATFVTTSSIYVGSALTSNNVTGGTAGGIVYQLSPGTTNFIGTGTTGQVLMMSNNTATWATVTISSTATNIAGGALGSIPYQVSNGLTNYISSGTTNQILVMGATTASWISTLTSTTLKATKDFVSIGVASTASFTLDLSISNVFSATMTTSSSFVFVNPPSTASNLSVSFTVIVTQDATGGRVPTWPATVKYAGGVQPPATTSTNAVDVWSFMSYTGGGTYIGSLAVKNAS